MLGAGIAIPAFLDASAQRIGPVASGLLVVSGLLAWIGAALLLRKQGPIVSLGGGLLIGGAAWSAAIALVALIPMPVGDLVAAAGAVGGRVVTLCLVAWMLVCLWRAGLLGALAWGFSLLDGRRIGEPVASGARPTRNTLVLGLVFGLLPLAPPKLVVIPAVFAGLMLLVATARADMEITSLRRRVDELTRRPPVA